MYLSDKICLLTSIAMPLVILAERQFSCSKKCETVTLPCGISLFDCFSGEHYNGDLTVKKYVKRVFLNSMEPFTQLQLSDEEYVLIRALIYSHMVTEGLSQYGRQMLQIEAENYAKILITILQNRYGPLQGARRYSDILRLIEVCFNVARHHIMLLTYVGNVQDYGRHEKTIPKALLDLCFNRQSMKTLQTANTWLEQKE
uniref:NR LBD domain-containing protein n=1 Tax=Meloidogyne enterolobii TaxID=390850 RepID=A0A6V7TUH0_MELEN|nr:unnamed protein product [Meloidogyne enterolobii]